MYLCSRGNDFDPFYALSGIFWNCYDSVVFLCFSFYYSNINTHVLNKK